MRDRLLIVDDEEDIVVMLRDYFEMNGYEVITAHSGREALKKAALKPDMILLDINMPDMDGLKVCQSIRDFVTCPILFLTARVDDSDKLLGFGAGGDDYVVKPFSMDELGARVLAHLRRERRSKEAPTVKLEGGGAIDYSARVFYWQRRAVNFAPKEFDIVELLCTYRGQVFDKERIYENVWGYDSDGDSSVVAEHIRRIRAKLSAAGALPYIETVWGVGYRWKR